jgi:hypothetical protein
MMGTADPQPSMFYHINLEQYVTADHPMRKIRPLIDRARSGSSASRGMPRPAAPRFHRSNCSWLSWAGICWA